MCSFKPPAAACISLTLLPSESALAVLYYSQASLYVAASLQLLEVYPKTLMGSSSGTKKSLEPFSPQQKHQSVTHTSAGLLLFPSHVRLSTGAFKFR